MLRQSATAFADVPSFRAGLVSLLVSLDLHDEARPILEAAASDRFEHVGSTAATLTALAMYADGAFQAADARAGAILYERLEPFAEQVVWTVSQGYGHVRMWLGFLAACLGQHQQADEHLQFACSFTMPTTCPYGRPGGSSAGQKHSPREVTPPRRAVTPPARSSSRATAATASSSHARRLLSRRSHRPKPDARRRLTVALAQCVRTSSSTDGPVRLVTGPGLRGT
jgi:hypothetical protein